jgi:AraC-like DNA-binding protein
MRATVDIKEFMADPTGRYVVGASWVYWCARPELFGLALWGRPSAEDMRSLIHVLRVELGEGIVPHASLIDASRLEGVDDGAFQALNAYVQSNYELLSERVTRLALVRSEGMVGAVTAGFYEVTGAPYPVQLVDGVDEGLEWLEGTPNPQLSATLAAICSDVVGIDPLLARLRAMIKSQVADPSIREITRSLGMSERTLQRRLKQLDTTFQREVGDVRVREAQRRMLDSDASLTEISIDLGFGSLQYFSTLFLRITGEQPSAWRKART